MTSPTGSVRPADEELDLYGVTHQGKVRSENQDHFLIATVHPEVVIRSTSLPKTDGLPLRGTRLATVLVVADGVGGAAAGSEAAQLATEAVTGYVSSTLRCYHAAGSATDDDEFFTALDAAALDAHRAVREKAALREDHRQMATTLTLSMAVWPWAYVVQVGDSRGYFYSEGKLQQITHDQTVAQELMDQGALSQEQLEKSPLRHVLSSAIGADEALPEVTRFNISERGSLILLCSDGLIKHVSDEEIAKSISTMTSSKQLADELLELALERGGHDNITIVIGRAPLKK